MVPRFKSFLVIGRLFILDKGDKYEKENWFSCGNYFYRGFSFWYFRVVQNPEQYQKTDPNIEAIMNSCEVTEAQAETIWGILQECGVGSIEIISRDTMLDGLYNTDDIGYRIRTEDGNNPVLYLNGAGEVSQIRWANQTLYPKS